MNGYLNLALVGPVGESEVTDEQAEGHFTHKAEGP